MNNCTHYRPATGAFDWLRRVQDLRSLGAGLGLLTSVALAANPEVSL